MMSIIQYRKLAEEAIKMGFLQLNGKKYYHRISCFPLNCDGCPIQHDCDYTLSMCCTAYESKLIDKWDLNWKNNTVFLFLSERPHMKCVIEESAITNIILLDESISFTFDDGCWVRIGLPIDKNELGDWEIQSDPENEDTYFCGDLWFNGEQIEDYDGCFDLPQHVKTALSFLGYHIDE